MHAFALRRGILVAAVALALPLTALASTTRAQVFTAQQVHRQIAALSSVAHTRGSSGAMLGDYGSHKLELSLRSVTGKAEVHEHYDDVMVVLGGHATLITGGSLIDAVDKGSGEFKGAGIRDGVSQQVAVGDIIHVPAGTPHQLIIPKGVLFRVLVVKIKE